jgi:hypothetical protein
MTTLPDFDNSLVLIHFLISSIGQSDGKDKNEKESAKDKKEKVKAGKDEKSDEASDVCSHLPLHCQSLWPFLSMLFPAGRTRISENRSKGQREEEKKKDSTGDSCWSGIFGQQRRLRLDVRANFREKYSDWSCYW